MTHDDPLPSNAGTGPPARYPLRSAAGLGLAAVTAGVASLAIDPDWDTIRLFFRVAAVVAAAGAILLLLPRRLGRAAVSGLILFHFAGILTAVTSVPPPGGPAPWLTTQLWARVFRPYLQFMYLNNAYHFYSPEPGPTVLLWARVGYADGSGRWVELPNRAADVKDPLALSYYRRLALTEGTNQLLAVSVAPPDAVRRRVLAGLARGIPTPDEVGLHVGGYPQYRVPNDYSRRLLQSFARFLARAHPHDDPAVSVAGVKVYRVVHAMVEPGPFLAGMEPTDPVLYLPFYQGEYDPDGNLKDPSDPFLYWLVPILRTGEAGTAEVHDFVEVHAGDKPGRNRQ